MHTVAGSDSIGVDEITVLADWTLRNMGYKVMENKEALPL